MSPWAVIIGGGDVGFRCVLLADDADAPAIADVVGPACSSVDKRLSGGFAGPKLFSGSERRLRERSPRVVGIARRSGISSATRFEFAYFRVRFRAKTERFVVIHVNCYFCNDIPSVQPGMFSAAPDADALLREYRRKESGKPAGQGRALGGAAGSSALGGGAAGSSALGDVDDLMARMEARVARLATEPVIDGSARQARREPEPSLATRRPAHGAKRPTGDSGSAVAELATLEREAKVASQQLEALRARVGALEAQCAAASLPIGMLEAPRSTASQPRAVAVESKRGADGTDLSSVIAKRLEALRGQAPQRAADVASMGRREQELLALVRAEGIAPADAASSGPSSMDPSKLLRALSALSDAVARVQTDAGIRNPAGVRGVGAATTRGAPSAIPVTVFSDGLMLFRGPFRAYENAAASSFATAVLGGQIPYELKQAYPNGVTFRLFDQCASTYAQAAASAAAKGGGPVQLGDLEGGHGMLAPQDAQRLLGRLPQSVLRDGALVPVRAEVAALIGAPVPGAPGSAAAPARSASEQEALRNARLRRFDA